MAEPEKEISPEEKLLKLIQEESEDEGSDEAAGEATQAVPPAEAPQIAKEAVPPVEEAAVEAEPGAAAAVSPEEKEEPEAAKPKLKLAEPAPVPAAAPEPAAAAEEPTGEEAGPVGEAAAAAAAPGKAAGTEAGRAQHGGLIGTSGRLVSGRRWAGLKPGIGTVNRILAAAVIVLILLVGYEIWANVGLPALRRGGQPAAEPAPSAGEPVRLPVAAVEIAASDSVLENVISAFRARPILVSAEQAAAADQTTTARTIPIPEADWRVYAKDNLSVIGFGGRTGDEALAVILDGKSGKMHILERGDEFRVGEGTGGDRSFKLEEIHSDHLVLSHGDDQITIE